MLIPFYKPQYAPVGTLEHEVLPYHSANLLSRLFFQYATPILKVGWSRPLEPEDLWQLTDDIKCKNIGERLHEHLLKRTPPSRRPGQYTTAEKDLRPPGLPDNSTLGLRPEKKSPSTSVQREPTLEEIKAHGRRKANKIAKGILVSENGKVYDQSLWKSVALTTLRPWLLNVFFIGTAQAFRITSPLMTKLLIEQMSRAYHWHRASTLDQSTNELVAPKPVGYGIGLAFLIWLMQFGAIVFNAQFTQGSNVMGLAARAGVIDLISEKSMRLSPQARLTFTNGYINTLITADASYLDWLFPGSVEIPTHFFVIPIGCALLIAHLGVSALCGIGVLVIFSPTQGWIYQRLLHLRREQTGEVDARVRVLGEIINSIRAVKLYAYENHFANKVAVMRNKEHAKLRRIGLFRATADCCLYILPIFSSIVTFITYGLLGHKLDVPTIFMALQFFNVLRWPVFLLGAQLTELMNCVSGIKRISEMLKADEVAEQINIVPGAEYAVEVCGSFDFDISQVPANPDNTTQANETGKPQAPCDTTTRASDGEPTKDEKPFGLRDIDLRIPFGSLVCIVGRVGTGKTALLSGMLNEMRQTCGFVKFGGDVSYVPQAAWIQSGTVQQNITFKDTGLINMERLNQVIDACALRDDVTHWRDGIETLLGEKGINLSGGQKQRICIARAAYQNSKVILLDDPLSAVDAHVGSHLVEHCLLKGPMASCTRILVTHQLDILPKADMILVMDRTENNEGHIVQKGTYQELMSTNGIFQTLIEEYGSAQSTGNEEDKLPNERIHHSGARYVSGGDKNEKSDGGIITEEEERVTGTVVWQTYIDWFRSMGSWWPPALALICLALSQVCEVGNALFLGFWSGQTIKGFSQGRYMALYGGFGVGYALFVWVSVVAFIFAGIRAGFTLFNGAWMHVMRSPTSWHDQTPTGRIISRLSRDFLYLDDRAPLFFQIFLKSLCALVGAAGLIIYAFPWMALAFLPVIGYYAIAATVYRQTSREIKRIDSLMCSHVYSSFAEQLAGLPVIRAFNQQREFQHRLQQSVDNQNRAAAVNLTLQGWLTIRLEVCSSMIVLLVGILGVVFEKTIDPAKFAVVLTYTLATSGVLNFLVSDFARVEQEMNSVERVLHYNRLQVEAAPTLPTDPRPEAWPTQGKVEFKSVELKYRPDLPLVLKGISFSIQPGEKIGIIGRTGAGKSSIAQALFRAVEPCGGAIEVDGVNVQSLGLETLRTRLAIIPQDAFLFQGSVRENIDPLGAHSDAMLNDALGLVHGSARASHSLRNKFRLDTQVAAEGSNFSAGEKQLLALMRALVRNCKVLLLDEATSSVDPETDALIQKFIQTQFADVTLISIAHRLQTVAFYDRILCLEGGCVAEFDTPLALYDNPDTIFRSMCEKKGLHRQDILNIQTEAAANHGAVIAGGGIA